MTFLLTVFQQKIKFHISQFLTLLAKRFAITYEVSFNRV